MGSRSLFDLIAEHFKEEIRKMEYLIYKMNTLDIVTKLKEGLSKRPKLMKQIVDE